MPTQAEKLLRIQQGGENGPRCAVSEADYKHRKMAGLGGQTYEEAGYEVVSYEDGTAYEDGSEPTEYAIASERAVQPIGEGDGHTNIDGSALSAAQKRDAVIVGAMSAEDGASKAAPARRARNAEAPAPAPTDATS